MTSLRDAPPCRLRLLREPLAATSPLAGEGGLGFLAGKWHMNGELEVEEALYMAFIERGKSYNKMTGDVARRHVAHIRDMDDRGLVALCGAFRGYPGMAGMYILKVASPEEAEALCKADPVVAEGYGTYKVRKLLVANRENGYLMG